MFFAFEGRVRATLYSLSGRGVAYRDVGPGDIVGELAAIDGAPRSATVEVLTPARLARLPAKAFRELVATRRNRPVKPLWRSGAAAGYAAGAA